MTVLDFAGTGLSLGDGVPGETALAIEETG
jgi:hypothetical protein